MAASPEAVEISSAKVLVVGAGGIGCELLKTIVLAGVSDIEIIDLDTIDVSNLNRQFLFRREHVGKSKVAECCMYQTNYAHREPRTRPPTAPPELRMTVVDSSLSQAEMAKEAVMKVRPDIKIKAHHGSVFEKK